MPLRTVVQIVANADDLGASERTNESVFRAMDEGLLTSATILANGEAFAEACSESKRFSACSFGVHLNLMDGTPCIDPGSLGDLVAADGRFNRGVRQSRQLVRLRGAIERELAAQISRVVEAGVRVSHFDSHYHVHTVPSLFPVIKSLMRRFRVRRVRTSLNYYPRGDAGLLKYLKKRAWKLALRSLPPAAITTDGLADIGTILAYPEAVPRSWRSVEIMFHPGMTCGASELTKWRDLLAEDPSLRGKMIGFDRIGEEVAD